MSHDEHNGGHHPHGGYHFKRHNPERLFVTGTDCIIFPLKIHGRPHSVHVKFIDAECVRLPGCNPTIHDAVTAEIVKLPDHARGVRICWKVTGTREIEWHVIELLS